MTLDSLKHAQKERLIFLDRCFTWRGMANRRDLIERFDISMAQAALDFRAYLALASHAPPTYDAVRKTYLAAEDHQPLVSSTLIEAFDILADEQAASLSSALPKPQRGADRQIISRLHQTIRRSEALHIRYTSMSSGADEGQWIAPIRFTSDGESVHLRAFSFKHGEFRYYHPIRIAPDSTFEAKALTDDLPEDTDWNTLATIWLRPHTGLSVSQAEVVRREFGFDGDFLCVKIRKALEFFFDRRWGLSEMGARLERAKLEYSHLSPDT
jgi:hypothetical protein